MTEDRLAILVQRPDVQRRILRNFDGDYSLGLTLDPHHPGRFAVEVQIEGEDASAIVDRVTLDGESVPVIVTPFEMPEPLPALVRAH